MCTNLFAHLDDLFVAVTGEHVVTIKGSLLQPQFKDLEDQRSRPGDNDCACVGQIPGNGQAIASEVDNTDDEGHLAREVNLGGTNHVEVGRTILV